MLASFSIMPVGCDESLSEKVAGIIDLVDRSGLDYRMGPMETTVEGAPGEVMDLIMSCHRLMKEVSPRVLTSIKIDDREGALGRLEGKIAAVEKIIGREVRK
jgi:uncharacterized protein (TIGR00106 family)